MVRLCGGLREAYGGRDGVEDVDGDGVVREVVARAVLGKCRDARSSKLG